MTRSLPAYNPANFAPSLEQAATIKVRQKIVRDFCLDTFRSPGFARHSDSGNIRTVQGLTYQRPLMLAKAAMINLGRNVMDFWPYFAVELGLPWDIWAWEIHGPSWTGTGSLMASVFCRTDLQGTLLSGGRWTPRRVATMDGFGIIESEDALFWIGEMGGTLSHVEHPHGTLVQIPKTPDIVAGTLLTLEPEAVFGKPPYTFSMGAPRPTWATLNSAATGRVFLQPPVGTSVGEYEVPVIMTDANGESDTATWTVTVTAPTT